VRIPTGTGRQLTVRAVAGDAVDLLVSIRVPGPDGLRPVYGGVQRLQANPAWKDTLLFYGYFRGDNGDLNQPDGLPWSRTCSSTDRSEING